MAFQAPINYAKAIGIESFPLAVAFGGVYVPLFLIFAFKWLKKPVYVLGACTLFCIVRITAFGMRAAFVKDDSLAEKQNMVMAESIIYSVGYFGVLSGAYNLVLDRDDATGTRSSNPLRAITGNRHIVRLVLVGAVVMGIIGTIDSQNSSNSASKIKTGNLLRKISVIVFLAVASLMIVNVLFSLMSEKRAYPDEKVYAPSFGRSHGMKVLLITSLFLTLREVFYVVNMNNLARQQQEKFFYPFSAGPELIALLTMTIPGLVPPVELLPY